jgi:hypothetical protein
MTPSVPQVPIRGVRTRTLNIADDGYLGDLIDSSRDVKASEFLLSFNTE